MRLRHLAGWSRRLIDSRGQTLAEYSLIITIIAVGTVVLATVLFGTALAGAFSSVGNCIDGSC